MELQTLVQDIPVEGRCKLLSLSGATLDERATLHGHGTTHNKTVCEILDTAQKIGPSAAKILFELKEYAPAEELFARYYHYAEAARCARLQGSPERAQAYLRQALEHRWRWIFLEEILDEMKESFPKEALTPLLEPVVRDEKKNSLNGRALYIRAFLSQTLGNQKEAERCYRTSKRKLGDERRAEQRILKSKRARETGAAEDACYLVEHLSEAHAQLCALLGKYDEAVSLLMCSLHAERLIKDEFTPHIEKRKDKEHIYEWLYDLAGHHSSPPDNFIAAQAAERAGCQERAQQYYALALDCAEKTLHLFTAFRCAQKLGLAHKTEKYANIARHLYQNKLI